MKPMTTNNNKNKNNNYNNNHYKYYNYYNNSHDYNSNWKTIENTKHLFPQEPKMK